MRFFITALFIYLISYLSADDINSQRDHANYLKDRGYDEKALEIYKELLKNNCGESSGEDLKSAHTCLIRIDEKNVDQFVDNVITQQPDNFFIYPPAVNICKRNTVRALQLCEKGYELLVAGEQKVPAEMGSDFCYEFTELLLRKDVSDLITLTDFNKQLNHGMPDRSGYKRAAIGLDGRPIFHATPASYAEAKTDGERYRSVLETMSLLGEAHEARAKRLYANFLSGQFRVNILSISEEFNVNPLEDSDLKSPLTLYTLKDEETSTELGDVVQRLTLPVEHNHILIYKELFESGWDDGLILAEHYLNRMQYVKAANILERSLKRKQDDKVQEILETIVDDRIKIKRTFEVFPVGAEPTLYFQYRNAKKVTVKVQKIDHKQIYEDKKKRLEGNPEHLDRSEADLIPYNKIPDQYLGEVFSSEEVKLEPREGHWTTVGNVVIPVKEEGVYKVTLLLDNGKMDQMVIHLDSMVITAIDTKGGCLYSVLDAITGEPVANAELEFFGFDKVNLRKPEGVRRDEVVTHKILAKTDKNGQYLVNHKNNFQSTYKYILQAKSEEKCTYFSFRGHQNIRYIQKSNKVHSFGITDRPVYRPDQTVSGKFWLRNVEYNKPDSSIYANKEVRIFIRDPKGEKIGDTIVATTDAFGGVEYSLDLPKDATLGRYSVTVDVKNFDSNPHYFCVKEYEKPEYKVSVESPNAIIKPGDSFEAIVKATYYHGAPVTNAKVKVKVVKYKIYSQLWFPKRHWDWLYGRRHEVFGHSIPDMDSYPGTVKKREYDISEDGTVKIKVDTKKVSEVLSHRYEIIAEVTDISEQTVSGVGQSFISAKPFEVVSWLDRGHTKVGDEFISYVIANTLDYRPVEAAGEMVVYEEILDSNGEISKERVATYDVATDKGGQIQSPLKIPRSGQFKIETTLKDKNGNILSDTASITIKDSEELEQKSASLGLELMLDKKTYALGDTAQLLIKTSSPNRFVTVFTRNGEFYQNIKVDGRFATLDIPITSEEIPNSKISAFTVSNAQVYRASAEILTPPIQYLLNVEVTANKEKYKSGDMGAVKVKVTDHQGNSVVGSVALTVYDRSLEYFSGSYSEDIKTFRTSKHEFDMGYNFSNISSRRFLPDERDSIQYLQPLGVFGRLVGNLYGVGGDGSSPYDPRADGILDHAYKEENPCSELGPNHFDDGINLIADNLSGLVKWQGHIKTDANGVATVPLEFPEHATIWKVRAWALTLDSQVGEGETEIIISK